MLAKFLSHLPVRRYDQGFFDSIDIESTPSAQRIVPKLLAVLGPSSVVDVGCGNGNWLNVFHEGGVTELHGIEGPWISDLLPRHLDFSIEIIDLNDPSFLSRRFDLAVSLEVAEHLPAESASRFVRFLTSLADVVVFSAAVPLQGGFLHLNEQWPAYWSNIFGHLGYDCFDVIRPIIWECDDVAPYYAQNMFVYLNTNRRPELAFQLSNMRSFTAIGATPLSMIHPRSFEAAASLRYARPRKLMQALPPAVFHALRDRLPRIFG